MPDVRLVDILDIVIVTALVYQLFHMIRGTRAVQLVIGVAILILAYAASRRFGLYTLQYVLQYLGVVIPIAVLVIFQPELRRMLEQLGRGGVLVSAFAPLGLGREETIRLVNKIGGLLVLERHTGLADYIETGIKVDAVVTVQLLISVFFPNSPLHDGAAIIRGNRVMAAGCLLPLSENLAVTKTLGTRHRAGLGVTEQTDAVAIIVSEETGTVTLAREGELHRDLSEEELKAALLTLFGAKPAPSTAHWRWWRTLRRT